MKIKKDAITSIINLVSMLLSALGAWIANNPT